MAGAHTCASPGEADGQTVWGYQIQGVPQQTEEKQLLWHRMEEYLLLMSHGEVKAASGQYISLYLWCQIAKKTPREETQRLEGWLIK